MKTKKEALATHWGCDIADLKDCRYHAGRTSIPVYTSGNDYYCSTAGDGKPAIYLSRGKNQSTQWSWVEVKDDYVNSFGFKIWKHKNI